MTTQKSICVFCGSKLGREKVYADAARELGTQFAQHGIRLVFGGGHIGLMGVITDAVLQNNGEVIGVIPESLAQRELAHQGVSDLRIVNSMHARKALMAELSDGFIALPGGLGTLEELCEVLTWSQLGFHNKPVFILNLNGYFDPLLELIDRGITAGFVSPENRKLFRVAETTEELMRQVLSA